LRLEWRRKRGTILAASMCMALRPGQWLGVLLLCAVVPATARASEPASLEAGYRLMYSFDFVAAGREFSQWTAGHPGHPLGPVSQADNLLVSELSRLGILDAELFASDESFTRRRRVEADQAVRMRFEAALADAARFADARLLRDPDDRDALFAMALVSGLRADYATLVEQHTMASLSYTRDGVRWANRLIAVAPDCADARLATGISEYVVGSLVAPLRWMLRLGGYSGNKSAGIEQVRFVAEHGRLLAPLARILLSIAYLREGDRAKAGEILAGLCRDFPGNPLFAREMLRLNRGDPP
jgi:hypothetical protein